MKFGQQDVPDDQVIEVGATVMDTSTHGVQVSANGRTEWVAKMYVNATANGRYAMPRWLAKDKGFI